MKRSLIAILGVAALAAAGCSQGPSNTSSTTPANTGASSTSVDVTSSSPTTQTGVTASTPTKSGQTNRP